MLLQADIKWVTKQTFTIREEKKTKNKKHHHHHPRILNILPDAVA
jgi:hypothetical protein